MRETMKELVKSTIMSIGMAFAIFCVAGIGFDIAYGGNFSLVNYGFTKMVLGCIGVGLGFGVPTIVYYKEQLPMPIKVLIHMGIGCVVYTLVAYAVGWIGGTGSIGYGILAAVLQLAVAFVLWACFMRYYRAQAKKMNEMIQKMNR